MTGAGVHGVRHSALLLPAGAVPGAARSPMLWLASVQAWWPGRRSFAVLLGAAGLWWFAQGLGILD